MHSSFPALFAAVFGLAFLLAPVLAPASRARADEPARAVAKVECVRAPEPGRVRCEIEVRAAPGTTLQWADAVVAKTPPFASPLRGRVGVLEATAHEDAVWRWAIALAARARGAGELVVRVRIVSCAKGVCAPAEIEAHGEITVGE